MTPTYSRTHARRIAGSMSRLLRQSRINLLARLARMSLRLSMPPRCRRALGTVAVHFCRVNPERETRRGAGASMPTSYGPPTRQRINGPSLSVRGSHDGSRPSPTGSSGPRRRPDGGGRPSCDGPRDARTGIHTRSRGRLAAAVAALHLRGTAGLGISAPSRDSLDRP